MMSKLIEQLKMHEGFRSKPYKCTAGKLTIGYGRNIEDVGISKEEAELLLQSDIVNCVGLLASNNLLYGASDRDDVLVNMCFNLGINRLLKFKKMIAAYKAGDYELAAKEMLDSKWARQVPNRAKELAEQMRTGEYQE